MVINIILLDYATLKIVWWLLIGILLIGFAIMDGHDMGVGTLLPFLGKSDEERRVIINTVSPHWEGNQTWFISTGGALFAAFPLVYATAFSGFYWAMMAVLWALFFRPVGFKYRSLVKNPTWRNAWDWGLFIGSFVPTLVFGVAFGNLFLGVPFDFDDRMVSHYTGSFWQLLNPFAIGCGLVSVAMLTMQGGTYIAHRTEDVIQVRAKRSATVASLLLVVLFIAMGFWVAQLDGYQVTSIFDPNAILSVMDKTVNRTAGGWLANFSKYPMAWGFPALGIMGALLAILLLKVNKTLIAFIASSLSVLGVIMTAGVALFPFLMPSSSHPNASLTIWDSVSSHLTLQIMLLVTAVLIPTIIFYTSWAYRVMRGKVTAAYIRENEHTVY